MLRKYWSLCVVACIPSMAIAVEAKYDGPPKHGGVYVIAHRGAHHGIPENTLSAYEKAIQLGADFVEIDLRTTKDGSIQTVARRIKDHGMQRQVVWCISPNDVDALRAACPNCIPMPDPESEETLPLMLERTKPTIVAPVWSDFSATFATTCHDVGAMVFVDERESTQANWQQALDWGADGIQTDDPAKLIAFLRERDRRRTCRPKRPGYSPRGRQRRPQGSHRSARGEMIGDASAEREITCLFGFLRFSLPLSAFLRGPSAKTNSEH